MLSVVAIVALSCVHVPKVVVFTCPDVPDEVIDDLGPAALNWYMHEFDTWCERLENAAEAGRG